VGRRPKTAQIISDKSRPPVKRVILIKDRGVANISDKFHANRKKVTKGLGPKPPKKEKPDDIPKIRKLATLKQYGFFNGIPPGFSPAERFFRQRPGGYGNYEGCRGTPPYGGTIFFTF